jgi:hypothetical protein
VQDILAEGIKLLLKTMTARLDDLQVQEHACRVLENLGGNEQPDAQHSIRCIVAEGGISLLLQVLAAHKGSSAVLGQACGAISNLAREQEYRLEMVEHGVIELLLASMDTHPTSPALQERACGALLNIGWSREDGAVLQYIHAKGGAARLEAAMVSDGATFKTRKWANSYEVCRVVTRKPASLRLSSAFVKGGEDRLSGFRFNYKTINYVSQ